MSPHEDWEFHEVAPDEWGVVEWLWQLFRHDLALVVQGRPYADGRYQHSLVDGDRDRLTAFLARTPHPNDHVPSPVAMAVVGHDGVTHTMEAFWVAPTERRTGLGRAFASRVLDRHRGEWRIGCQHDNEAAVLFWRKVANEAFGVTQWREVRQPVARRPGAPDDHIIEGRN